MERFNYFRKPYNERNQTDTSWVRKHRFAGDRIVQDALDGKADIGLLLKKVRRRSLLRYYPKKEIGDAGGTEKPMITAATMTTATVIAVRLRPKGPATETQTTGKIC